MMQIQDKRSSHGLSVKAEGLDVIYGEGPTEIRALRKLSLTVPAGQFLVIRGRSGSGKTTLFYALAGMRAPTAGRVLLGDTEMNALSESESARFRRRRIGLVYQFFNLVPMLDVTENVALPLLLDGHRLTDVLPRVEAMMERLEIYHRANHPVRKLSGGEMQRVAIARALLGEPGLVLADEPTGNLDELSSGQVLSFLTEVCRERGTTIILMTHDPDAALRCDRMIKLRDGEIEQDLGPF